MGQRSIPGVAVGAVITIVVLLVGFLLYRGATGGTVGDGNAGNVQASPPGQHAPQSSPASAGAGQKAP